MWLTAHDPRWNETRSGTACPYYPHRGRERDMVVGERQQQKRGSPVQRCYVPVERTPFDLFFPSDFLSLSPSRCRYYSYYTQDPNSTNGKNEFRDLLRESSIGRKAHFVSALTTKEKKERTASINNSLPSLFLCTIIIIFCQLLPC